MEYIDDIRDFKAYAMQALKNGDTQSLTILFQKNIPLSLHHMLR